MAFNKSDSLSPMSVVLTEMVCAPGLGGRPLEADGHGLGVAVAAVVLAAVLDVDVAGCPFLGS